MPSTFEFFELRPVAIDVDENQFLTQLITLLFVRLEANRRAK
jgi:hypothetical protein